MFTERERNNSVLRRVLNVPLLVASRVDKLRLHMSRSCFNCVCILMLDLWALSQHDLERWSSIFIIFRHLLLNIHPCLCISIPINMHPCQNIGQIWWKICESSERPASSVTRFWHRRTNNFTPTASSWLPSVQSSIWFSKPIRRSVYETSSFQKSRM